MDVCPKPKILTSLTTFKPSPPHPPLMETSRILGIAGIVIVIAAACFAAGLMFNDNGDDQGDGGDSSDSGSETNRVEYRLDLQDNVTSYSIDIRFSAPVSGSYKLYVGDEPLRNVDGEILGESWTGAQWVHGMWWAPYEPGQSFDDIEILFHVEFSSNLDPVRVY